MKKINWKQKLSSRKFWMAVSSFVCAICVLFGVDELTTEKLTATLGSCGVMIAYILAEGYIDSKRVEKE